MADSTATDDGVGGRSGNGDAHTDAGVEADADADPPRDWTLAAADLASRRSTLWAGLVWGATAGVGFVGVVLLVVGVAVAATSGNLFFLPVVAVVGSLIAAVVGAFLGTLFAAVDLGLLAAARRIAEGTAGA